MQELFSNPFLWTAVAALILLSVLPAPSSIKAPRRGIDPGFLNFKLWPARILFLTRGYKIVEDAYHECKGEKYLLQTMLPDRVVLPPKFLAELRMLSTNKLNASSALVATTLGHHNGVDIILKDRQSNNICRVQLTKSLTQIMPLLAHELDLALSKHLVACTHVEYKPYNIKDLIFALNMRTTTLSFAGMDLCRNQEWATVITDYQDAVAGIAISLIPFPEFLRPFIKPFIPASKLMKRVHNRVHSFLFDTENHQNDDMPTVLKHYIATSKQVDKEEIVAKFLVLSSAALHTMTSATIHVIFDLCVMPQYIEELREEALDALKKNHGQWISSTTKAMKRMDSFFKDHSDLTRLASVLAFDRVVQSPIELSDGTVLQTGQFISFPASPMAKDPEYYQNPLKFEGYRFYRGENFSSDQERSDNEFVGIEPWNIHWGNGRFTCPGRWYASAVMKMFIASIILNYDIKFPDGQTERPKNSYLDDGIVPNPNQQILFKLRNRYEE